MSLGQQQRMHTDYFILTAKIEQTLNRLESANIKFLINFHVIHFSSLSLSLYSQSIAHVVASKSFMHRLPVNVLIRRTDSQPIVAMTAKEFMLGYKSELIQLGNTLLPHWIYFDKVGLIDRVSSDCD